jgi:hypothetical protein
MALSKKDQEFYEEKLSLKMAGYLILYTALLGAVAVPTALYILDFAAGTTGGWSFSRVTAVAEVGAMFGCIIAVVMYLAFKLLLQVGWLPSRH